MMVNRRTHTAAGAGRQSGGRTARQARRRPSPPPGRAQRRRRRSRADAVGRRRAARAGRQGDGQRRRRRRRRQRSPGGRPLQRVTQVHDPRLQGRQVPDRERSLRPPADDASAAGARKFRRLARRAVRASRAGAASSRSRTQGSGQPVRRRRSLADTPTAVFSVFKGQYNAATTAVGMLPDVQGALLARVKTSLYTAIVLRNRLVKVVAAAAPPAPAEEGRVHRPSARAAQDEDATTFDVVMPGVTVLLDDEIQQMTADPAGHHGAGRVQRRAGQRARRRPADRGSGQPDLAACGRRLISPGAFARCLSRAAGLCAGRSFCQRNAAAASIRPCP